MTEPTEPPGLLRKVDCVQLPVPDLEGGLAFYRHRLGHELLWRTETAAGLRLGDSDSELVLQTNAPSQRWTSWSAPSTRQLPSSPGLAAGSWSSPLTFRSDGSRSSPTRSGIGSRS